MAINVNLLGLDGATLDGASWAASSQLDGIVSIENDETSSLTVSGIQILATGQTVGFDASQLQLSPIDTSVYGNAYTGSTLATIAAGETGSYRFSVTYAGAQPVPLTTNPSFALDALTIFNNAPQSSSVLNSPTFVQLQSDGSPPTNAFITSPILSWSKTANYRPVTNADYDFSLETSLLGSDGNFYTLESVGLASDYTSSDTGVVSVVSSSLYSYTTVNGMAKSVGGAGAVTVVGVGSATIQNRIAPGVTGSIVITVTA